MIFIPLTPELLTAIEPWFDDPDTARHLGGREWLHHAHNLMHIMPAVSMGGITVLDRCCWVVVEGDFEAPSEDDSRQAEEDGHRVALLDVEVYDDATASLAIVVAPKERGRGVARRVLSCLWDLPYLDGVESVFGSIDADNEASKRCFTAAGFTIASKPDHDNMLRVEMLRPRVTSTVARP